MTLPETNNAERLQAIAARSQDNRRWDRPNPGPPTWDDVDVLLAIVARAERAARYALCRAQRCSLAEKVEQNTELRDAASPIDDTIAEWLRREGIA